MLVSAGGKHRASLLLLRASSPLASQSSAGLLWLVSPEDTLVPAVLSVLCFHPSQQHWHQRLCVQLFSAHTAHALY